jgi:hypothetical protein
MLWIGLAAFFVVALLVSRKPERMLLPVYLWFALILLIFQGDKKDD